jgi:hypothetical protein
VRDNAVDGDEKGFHCCCLGLGSSGFRLVNFCLGLCSCLHGKGCYDDDKIEIEIEIVVVTCLVIDCFSLCCPRLTLLSRCLHCCDLKMPVRTGLYAGNVDAAGVSDAFSAIQSSLRKYNVTVLSSVARCA